MSNLQYVCSSWPDDQVCAQRAFLTFLYCCHFHYNCYDITLLLCRLAEQSDPCVWHCCLQPPAAQHVNCVTEFLKIPIYLAQRFHSRAPTFPDTDLTLHLRNWRLTFSPTPSAHGLTFVNRILNSQLTGTRIQYAQREEKVHLCTLYRKRTEKSADS